jgi:hypothetical protein
MDVIYIHIYILTYIYSTMSEEMLNCPCIFLYDKYYIFRQKYNKQYIDIIRQLMNKNNVKYMNLVMTILLVSLLFLMVVIYT